MAVDSVLFELRPTRGSFSGNNSRATSLAVFEKELPAKTPATDNRSRVAGTGLEDAPQHAAATADSDVAARAARHDTSPADHFQSEWEQALRAGEAAAGGATSASAGSRSSQTSAAIALYKRIDQIGSNETITSELLERWNSIVQGAQ